MDVRHTTPDIKELAEEVYLDAVDEAISRKGAEMGQIVKTIMRYFLIRFYDQLDAKERLAQRYYEEAFSDGKR